jgi:hypothetical protein
MEAGLLIGRIMDGWDRETSYPRKKTLIDLDLEHVARDLGKMGKLG